jgi:hypothetical protein
MVIPPPCESAASQYRVGLIRFVPGRVLVFHGGVFGCSSRMNGKPSSPVLRGLGASDGARLLDPYNVTEGLPVTLPESGLRNISDECTASSFRNKLLLKYGNALRRNRAKHSGSF